MKELIKVDHCALLDARWPSPARWFWGAKIPIAVTLTVATPIGLRSWTFARDSLSEGMLGNATPGVSILPDAHHPTLYMALPGMRIVVDQGPVEDFLEQTFQEVACCGKPAFCTDPSCQECIWSYQQVDGLIKRALDDYSEEAT